MTLHCLKKIHQEVQNKGPFLAVFDLDSTLFDISPRIQRILQDFALDPENQIKYPKSTQILKNIEIHPSDWGFKESLVRAGLDEQHPDFHSALKDYWYDRFFSNQYLHFDRPYDGAVEYVNSLFSHHVDIVYLSGRDIPRMQEGTHKVLKSNGFPLSPPRAQTVLKRNKEDSDPLFKSEWFASLPTAYYKKIYFFENDPVNIHHVRQDHQHIEVVFFHSTHSGRMSQPSDIPKIMHYLLDD